MTAEHTVHMTEDEEPSPQGLSLEFLRDHIQGHSPEAEADQPQAVSSPTSITEDELPSPAGLDTENWLKISKQRHMNQTRTRLATGLLWLVAVLAVIPTLALVFGHWTHFKADDYREVSLVFTPVVALASAAFGFFFASDERNRDL